jgi:H+/Cl- antiporter ClcA
VLKNIILVFLEGVSFIIVARFLESDHHVASAPNHFRASHYERQVWIYWKLGLFSGTIAAAYIHLLRLAHYRRVTF